MPSTEQIYDEELAKILKHDAELDAAWAEYDKLVKSTEYVSNKALKAARRKVFDKMK